MATPGRFYRVRVEVPAIKALYEEQQAISAEYGQHPYLYPQEVKARWLALNDLIMADAKNNDEREMTGQ